MWRARVADAARRAAAELNLDHEPELHWLHQDLLDLSKRLEGDAEPPS